MKNIVLLIAVPFLVFSNCAAQQSSSGTANLLVFTKTDGFRHQSIPAGVEALRQIAGENGYSIEHTEDAARFNAENLKSYDAIVFLNTTENIFNEEQQTAFQQYIRNGGGFVGIHSATDTEYDWPWYGQLVGAYFNGHPKVQEATVEVLTKDHISTAHLPNEWIVTDEWYNFKNIQQDLNILARLDESSYEGGTNGENHPIAWYHEFDGGRAFYTGRGHTDESFSEPMFRQHILGGIKYVLGE